MFAGRICALPPPRFLFHFFFLFFTCALSVTNGYRDSCFLRLFYASFDELGGRRMFSVLTYRVDFTAQ